MTVRLRDVVAFLDTTLEIERFRDYGPNGLQVEGAPEVSRIVTGVSACTELFDKAAKVGADLIRDDVDGTRSYLVLADTSYRDYLFAAISDATAEFGLG